MPPPVVLGHVLIDQYQLQTVQMYPVETLTPSAALIPPFTNCQSSDLENMGMLRTCAATV